MGSDDEVSEAERLAVAVRILGGNAGLARPAELLTALVLAERRAARLERDMDVLLDPSRDERAEWNARIAELEASLAAEREVPDSMRWSHEAIGILLDRACAGEREVVLTEICRCIGVAWKRADAAEARLAEVYARSPSQCQACGATIEGPTRR